MPEAAKSAVARPVTDSEKVTLYVAAVREIAVLEYEIVHGATANALGARTVPSTATTAIASRRRPARGSRATRCVARGVTGWFLKRSETWRRPTKRQDSMDSFACIGAKKPTTGQTRYRCIVGRVAGPKPNAVTSGCE